MPFATSTYLQRLAETILGGPPPGVRRLESEPREATRMPRWDPYECSSVDKKAIRDALEKISLTYVPEINGWPGVGMELANRLAGLGEDTIYLACDCVGNDYARSSTRANPAGRVKYDMSICADRTHLTGQQRADIILWLVFREAVKLVGGNAVDYYSLWAYFELTDRTQNPIRWGGPTPTWMDYMCAEGRVLSAFGGAIGGTFMVWSSVPGVLYMGEKVNPTRGVQALTNGGFSLPNWQHAC